MLERPSSGTVTVDGLELTALPGSAARSSSDRVGRELRAARRRIGMVFQHFNLLASRTVQQNVELPLELAGLDRTARRRRAGELLELVGLGDKAGSYPSRLSGGQKQRVGIARALAGDPKVLLSDEATSALDPETTRSILKLLRELNRELGLTVLLITHEMDVIKSVCDSAALMRGGRIVESGTLTELLANGRSELARELFPLGEAGPGRPGTVLEITFQGESAGQPFISQLARTYQIDLNILGAAVETIGGRPVGRMRVELPGDHHDNVVPIGYLREQGLQVDVLGAGADTPNGAVA
jgi:D-methionine transport system ATP-binding protein